MTMVAAIVVVGIIVSTGMYGAVLGDVMQRAICEVTSLGQGPCASQVTSAEEHEPTEPCVVNASGQSQNVRATFVVTLGQDANFLVEELNNGQYRVTRGQGSTAGIGVGVGFNVTGTWDDKTYGGAAGASADVAAQFAEGEVYYVDSQEDASAVMAAHYHDIAKDSIVGDGGPGRWLVDKGLAIFDQDHPLPEWDERYIEGGVSADASAQATWIAANAEAEAGIQATLGAREDRDGSTTTYYRALVEGEVGAGTWAGDENGDAAYYEASAGGKMEAIVEVDRDSEGNVTAVRTKAILDGEAKATEAGSSGENGPSAAGYVEQVVELPVRSHQDQVLAQRYLNSLGAPPLAGFPALEDSPEVYAPIASPVERVQAGLEFNEAARNRGYTTRQSFAPESSSYGGTFDAKWIAEVGGSVEAQTEQRTATEAEYWDGSRWVQWEGCAA